MSPSSRGIRLVQKVESLTAAKFASLCKPRTSRLEIGDGAIQGLRLRVLPNGKPTWLLTVFGNGRYQRVTFGDGMGLADARREAERLRGEVKQGADPTQQKRDAKLRAVEVANEAARKAAKEKQTLGALVSGYFATGDGAGLRTRKEQERCIRVVFTKAMALPVAETTEVALQRLADSHPAKIAAARAVAYLSPILRYGRKRGWIEARIELEKPGVGPDDAESGGQRVLTADEVRKVWPALKGAQGRAARFALLAGVRREEVCGATWGEFDLDSRVVDHLVGKAERHAFAIA